MFPVALRSVRAAVRPALTRAYAAPVSVDKKLTLNLATPHETYLNKAPASLVKITAADGDLGILAEHEPTISELIPGVVEVYENEAEPKKFFVTGGFAIIHGDSTLSINATEAYPLEEIDYDVVKKELDAARNKLNDSDAVVKATAEIESQVYESILATQSK